MRPESPRFANGAEKTVWDALCAQLGPSDVLLSGLRFTDRAKDYEADVVVLMPGYGVVVVEVKGGSVWRADGEWLQRRGGHDVRIDPADQARACKYALRAYIESDPRWTTARRRVRWIMPSSCRTRTWEPTSPPWTVLGG